MKFTISVELKASSPESAQKTAEVIQKLLKEVPESKINELHDLLNKRPNIINEILEKINNPLVKKLFG